MAIIDLDLTAGGGETPETRRRGPGRHRRWLWTLALAVVVPMLAATSSNLPAPPLQRTGTVPATLRQSFQLFDDGLYVEDGQQPHGGQVNVSSYDLTGARRWTRQLPGAAAETVVYQTSGEALIYAGDINRPTAFIAEDRATGRQLWSGRDVWGAGEPFVLAVDRRGRLLVNVQNPRGPGSTVHWLDTRTGRNLWTVGLSSGWSIDLGDAQPSGVLWIVGQAGQLVAITLDDAGTQRSIPLAGLPDAVDVLYRSVTVGVGAIVVTDETDHTTVVRTYDAVSYRPRWTQTIPGAASIQSCGPDLCELGNSEFVAVDPRSGETLWRTGPVAVHPFWWQLVTEPFVAPGVGSPAVVDARTGRVLVDLSDWQVQAIVYGKSMLLMRQLVGVAGEWLGRLDAGSTEVTILGRMPGLSSSCAMTAAHLACQRMDGTIIMWRMTR